MVKLSAEVESTYEIVTVEQSAAVDA